LRPVVIYSDAAAVERDLRLGLMVIVDGVTHVASADIPYWIVDTWLARKNYINLGELIAAPMAAVLAPHLLRGRDVLWWIDNTTALSVLIMRGSSAQDAAKLVMIHNLAMAALGTRCWYDWVPSATNPSDVLSRDAWESEEVIMKMRNGEWKLIEGSVPWERLTNVSFQAVWDMFAASGQ
jgi:hypothetical protein